MGLVELDQHRLLVDFTDTPYTVGTGHLILGKRLHLCEGQYTGGQLFVANTAGVVVPARHQRKLSSCG